MNHLLGGRAGPRRPSSEHLGTVPCLIRMHADGGVTLGSSLGLFPFVHFLISPLFPDSLPLLCLFRSSLFCPEEATEDTSLFPLTLHAFRSLLPRVTLRGSQRSPRQGVLLHPAPPGQCHPHRSGRGRLGDLLRALCSALAWVDRCTVGLPG